MAFKVRQLTQNSQQEVQVDFLISTSHKLANLDHNGIGSREFVGFLKLDEDDVVQFHVEIEKQEEPGQLHRSLVVADDEVFEDLKVIGELSTVLLDVLQRLFGVEKLGVDKWRGEVGRERSGVGAAVFERLQGQYVVQPGDSASVALVGVFDFDALAVFVLLQRFGHSRVVSRVAAVETALVLVARQLNLLRFHHLVGQDLTDDSRHVAVNLRHLLIVQTFGIVGGERIQSRRIGAATRRQSANTILEPVVEHSDHWFTFGSEQRIFLIVALTIKSIVTKMYSLVEAIFSKAEMLTMLSLDRS